MHPAASEQPRLPVVRQLAFDLEIVERQLGSDAAARGAVEETELDEV